MMKKRYKHFAVLGTLCCIGALVILWMAVLTVDWVSIQEPQVDQLELDKLGPYEEPRPHLIRAKFGLFKMCIQLLTSAQYSSGSSNTNSHMTLQLRNTGPGGSGAPGSPIECVDLDWYNFGLINFDSSKKPPVMPTELIANCVEKLRFTLPFIGLSVIFTSGAFSTLIFSHFCQKNKKIIEASMLILGGLCQATALLTFVAQIGSEFEANLPFSHHQSRLTTFYRYKYGYSFYLFLLSFGLSELGAFFNMLAYFRKYPPSTYVITFSRQEPSPFMSGTGSLVNTLNHVNHSSNPPPPPSTHAHHQNTFPKTNMNNLNASATYHHHQQLHQHHLDLHQSPQQYGTLPKQPHSHHHTHFSPLPHHGPPDLCTDFSVPSGGDIELKMRRDAYISPEVTITTIERSTGVYGTIRPGTKLHPTGGGVMESFGTMRKENNI